MCARACVCVCTCVGSLVVQLVESWAYNPEDTGSNPRAEEKKSQVLSPPIRVPGLVLGSKVHWLCLIESLKASVGLRVPTPAVRDTVGAPASFLPGSGRLRSTGTQYLLGAQVSWLCQVRVTFVAARCFAFCFCVYLCVCLSLLPPQPHNMNLDQFM